MAGILADDKVRFGMLCFSVCLFYSYPSFGASPQPLTELQITSDTVVVPSAIKSSLAKKPLKGESPQQIYAGTKQSHSEPANGKVPPKPKDFMLKRKHPIDKSTENELLPMPVEPKH